MKAERKKLIGLSVGIGVVILLFTMIFIGPLTLARNIFRKEPVMTYAELERYYAVIQHQEDVELYYRYAQTMKAGYLPYKDFQVEYPSGAIPVILVPALFTDDPIMYQLIFSIEMGLFTLGAGVLAWKFVKKIRKNKLDRLSTVFIISSLLCGTLLVARYDAVAAFLLVLTAYFALEDKPAYAGAAAAIGFSVKLFPILAVIPYGVYLISRKRWKDVVRMCVSFAVLLGMLFLPGLIISPSGLLDSFLYHAKRGLQIESVFSTPLWLVYSLTAPTETEFGYGSVNLSGTAADRLAAVALPLFVLSFFFVVIVLFSKFLKYKKGLDHKKLIFLACFAIIVAFIVFNKVFSPQYMIWIALLSGLGVAYLPKKWFYFQFITQALTVLIFPLKYTDLMNTDHIMVNVLIWRNLLIFGLWVWVVIMLIKTTKVADK